MCGTVVQYITVGCAVPVWHKTTKLVKILCIYLQAKYAETAQT